MKMMTCRDCSEDFDLFSHAKRTAGGLINLCPDCSSEPAVKYAGVQAADGKQAQATILKFTSQADKTAYVNFWRNNSGMNVGKSCQLGAHLSTTPNVKFETITAFQPTNHKGKAT